MITQAELKERLTYRDGELFWEVPPKHNSKLQGKIAGSTGVRGYRVLRLDGILYKEHHLVWLWNKGKLPKREMDHINGLVSDNRIENLREVSSSQNKQNRGRVANNTSGFTGVHYHKNRGYFVADITIDGVRSYLGKHDNPLEAALHRFTVEQCDARWSHGDRSTLRDEIKQVWEGFNA